MSVKLLYLLLCYIRVSVSYTHLDVYKRQVQRRIAQLIQEDRFYTEEEQNRFDDIDPIAIREALEERGIVNGQVTDCLLYTSAGDMSGKKPRHRSFGRIDSAVTAYCPITTIC